MNGVVFVTYLILLVVVGTTRIDAAARGSKHYRDNETGNESDKHDYISGVKIYQIETTCAMTGGLCVEANDCVTLASTRGLCPNNRRLGVECCYELPIRPAPCRQHLGICTSRCGSGLRRPATDCESNQHCCVLV